MATISAYLTACQAPGMTSERIAKGIAMLAAATFDATWEEFQVPAANLQCETLEAMRVLHAQALGRELEAARQHEIRLENERQAKVLAEERARIDAETAALRKRAAEVEAAERRQREADEAEQRRQRDQFLRDNPPAQLQQTLEAAAPAAVWTDEDPDAATKLPTTEVVERTDPQEAEVLATASAPEPHEFSLGDLSAWLGLTVNLVFVERMGIKPHAVPGNAARRLTKTQRREFRAALLRHVEGLQA
jgi:flagellar biosynthesis GTPase FlhF